MLDVVDKERTKPDPDWAQDNLDSYLHITGESTSSKGVPFFVWADVGLEALKIKSIFFLPLLISLMGTSIDALS